MSSKILFLFEGEKREIVYAGSIFKKVAPRLSDSILSSFNNNIWDLFLTLEKDSDVDIVEIIRGRSEKNKQLLAGVSRNQISEIYLIFDMDAQDAKYSKAQITSLLNKFNNETDSGSLFISYPMIEALRHVGKNRRVFFDLKVPMREKKYKEMVSIQSDPMFSNIKSISVNRISYLIKLHIRKSNYLKALDVACIEKKFIDCGFSPLTQIDLFDIQCRDFIDKDSTVSVLSALPLFLHQYYGDKVCTMLNGGIHYRKSYSSRVINCKFARRA